MDASHAFNGADAVSFRETLNHVRLFFSGEDVRHTVFVCIKRITEIGWLKNYFRITLIMPKAGRPKLPKNELRAVFPMRLSKDERKSVEKAAQATGEKATQWARNQLMRAAGHDIRTT